VSAESTAEVRPHRHPGSGRRRGATTPKGRQVDPAALEEVLALLGARSRQRDLLIEHLHLIQDRYGHLSAAHLAALASEMKLALTEVYEVATFYAHFDVVREGEAAPPTVTVRVCDSLTCEMLGGDALLEALRTAQDPKKVRVIRAPCMGACDRAPVCAIGHDQVFHATAERVGEALAKGGAHHRLAPEVSYDAYVADGGYRLLKDCLADKRTRDELIKVMEDSGLRGLGGAGFPTGRKWSLVRAEKGPRLMAVNGDEGEPGTFKDRHYLHTRPHQFLEGMAIAAWAVEAKEVFVYCRDEYPAALRILRTEIARLERKGLLAHTKVHVRRGAGAYICGEESAMIESIEGKRGLPRHRPPYVAQVGIFNRPTLVNNIETLYWVPQILEHGADWFASQGKNGAKGLRSYSVSGRVKTPGVVLTAAGSTANDLIAACGGMLDGHTFKGYLPGGASGGILPASMADIPLDFGQLEKHGCFVGSHAVVILSDRDDMKDVALNLMRFFEDESCGQCTPCRNGTEKAVKLMQAKTWDKPLLEDLAQVMRDASICGLGQAASNPLVSVLKFFAKDAK
jgi:formate dehydrogenase